MVTSVMINAVKNVAKKHENDKVGTFDTRITDMCNDIVPKLEKLLEYERLEEQGLLLKLPCKVGDTVWDIAGKKIREQIVDGIEHRTDGFFIYANEDEWLGKLGELVFLTKAEAEKALAEMEK